MQRTYSAQCFSWALIDFVLETCTVSLLIKVILPWTRYGLGRAAMAGCAESLAALLEAVEVEDGVAEHKPSLALSGTDTQRAAMHGLSTSGDAGACSLKQLSFRLF